MEKCIGYRLPISLDDHKIPYQLFRKGSLSWLGFCALSEVINKIPYSHDMSILLLFAKKNSLAALTRQPQAEVGQG